MTRLKDFLISDAGPTATEYAIMLALIILVCIAAVASLGNSASAKFVDVDTALQ